MCWAFNHQNNWKWSKDIFPFQTPHPDAWATTSLWCDSVVTRGTSGDDGPGGTSSDDVAPEARASDGAPSCGSGGSSRSGLRGRPRRRERPEACAAVAIKGARDGEGSPSAHDSDDLIQQSREAWWSTGVVATRGTGGSASDDGREAWAARVGGPHGGLGVLQWRPTAILCLCMQLSITTYVLRDISIQLLRVYCGNENTIKNLCACNKNSQDLP
jgi:hypothetical protein